MKRSNPKYMICYWAKRYCSEDISLIENYELMINDYTQRWCCHHRREIDENKSRVQLITEGCYYKVPAEELIFMTVSDHNSLHHKDKIVSDEAKKKLSDSHKGVPKSEETKKKIGAAKKGNKYALGMHWYNNGTKNVFAKECPEGYEAGMLKK